ncbi:sodium:proline symporter [Halovulum sp. GXIMD14794]
MPDLSGPWPLILFTAAIAALGIAQSARRGSVEGFFAGTDDLGRAPGLWTLVLSQVTTWIFARSLMNAAVLGFYYGIAGTLAYTAYYASFLTGGFIVNRLRAGGAGSVQDWLRGRFGAGGTLAYNLVVGLRLMSEVFANLLVVGAIFAATTSAPYARETAIVVLAVLGLGYSLIGGLRSSLKTDVGQMLIFLAVLTVAFAVLVTAPDFSWSAAFTAQGTAGPGPGLALLAVAALQVFSYPAHDPVMMDRGFLADRRTTNLSFLHAFWISALCILGFGLFGVQAGLLAAEGEGMQEVWSRMFGPAILFCINASLLVSALSTLDSALASSARLAVVEMKLGARTLANGRIAMAVFMLGGVLFLLAGTEDLFAAVAVSGTASMFLAPVLFFGLVLNRPLPLWSFGVAFAAAIAGATGYFFEDSTPVMTLFGDGHKYERLLGICLAVLVVGSLACGLGAATRGRVAGARGR